MPAFVAMGGALYCFSKSVLAELGPNCELPDAAQQLLVNVGGNEAKELFAAEDKAEELFVMLAGSKDAQLSASEVRKGL